MAATTSCSDNHDDSDRPISSDRAIAFTATVPKAPRAVTTTSTINSFKVWSFFDSKPFMSDVSVNKTGDKWEYSPVMYWPVEGTLNFYSISPDIKTITNVTDATPDIPGFKNFGRTDLLYAVNMDESRTSPGVVNNQLVVNFRHALSQVIFNLKRKRDDITIKVYEVSVEGTYQDGSFDFPKETTGANISSEESRGTWSSLNNIDDVEIFKGTPVEITDATITPNNSGYIFAIPQTLSVATGQADEYDGSYVEVLCEIFNSTSGAKLWPSNTDTNYDASTGAGSIVFPLRTTAIDSWVTGKKYVYTLNIDVPESNNGKIDFDVTVDDYSTFEDAPAQQ